MIFSLSNLEASFGLKLLVWPLKPCKIELSRRLLIIFQKNQNIKEQLRKYESQKFSGVGLSEKEEDKFACVHRFKGFLMFGLNILQLSYLHEKAFVLLI